MKKGKVFLTGAGPGDPSLITLKGIESLKKADVIVYDYLISKDLLKYASKKVEFIYVGKKEGKHTISQDEINKLLINKARNRKIVVRLKGGDPFIFGRGGEELETLKKSDVEFEVIPGITSGIAASSYAGIPLTHRNYSSMVSFITGHEDYDKEFSSINWKAVSGLTGTLVFFMGVKNLINIVDNLKFYGKSINTPVAVIRWGTTNKQFTVVGVLDNIVSKCLEEKIKAPAIVVIGDVVKLRDNLKWFENKPLIGRTILITRARVQSSSLIKLLSELGADCIECPTIEIINPSSWFFADKAIENINKYDWIIFTSVNGVDYFMKRLFEKGNDVRLLYNIKIAVIGPATGKRLRFYGLKYDVMPLKYCSESVVDAFSKKEIKGKSICLLRAEEARDVIPIALSKMGAFVDDIPVYSIIKTKIDRSVLNELKSKKVDLITFTSSSTVNNFRNYFFNEELKPIFNSLSVACIGPITAMTAHKLGFKVDVVSKEYTIEGLCKSILSYYCLK